MLSRRQERQPWPQTGEPCTRDTRAKRGDFVEALALCPQIALMVANAKVDVSQQSLIAGQNAGSPGKTGLQVACVQTQSSHG